MTRYITIIILIIIGLIACNVVYFDPEGSYEIKWDPVKYYDDGTLISHDVIYSLTFANGYDKVNEIDLGETYDNYVVLAPSEMPDTDGNWYFGVSAITGNCKSEFTWSDNPSGCENGKTFSWEVVDSKGKWVDW